MSQAGNIVYSRCPVERTEDVTRLLLTHFFRDEPIGRAVGLPTSQVSGWLHLYIRQALEQGASFMACEADSGNLIGISVNLLNNGDGSNNLSMGSFLNPETEPLMCLIGQFLGELNSGFQRPNQPEKVATCCFLNTDPKYGAQGIAWQLTLMAEKYALELGINSFQVDTTSEFSYKMYKKVGYETLKEVEFAQFEHNGVKILQDKDMGVHKRARILYKVVEV